MSGLEPERVLQPGGHAPEGLQNSAQGFNPGNRHPERCALKGRQIERPNQAEAGSDGPIVERPNCAP